MDSSRWKQENRALKLSEVLGYIDDTFMDMIKVSALSRDSGNILWLKWEHFLQVPLDVRQRRVRISSDALDDQIWIRFKLPLTDKRPSRLKAPTEPWESMTPGDDDSEYWNLYYIVQCTIARNLYGSKRCAIVRSKKKIKQN